MTKSEIKSGDKFGRLTVRQFLLSGDAGNPKPYGVWVCECECGNKRYVPTSSLGKKQKSCGCSRFGHKPGDSITAAKSRSAVRQRLNDAIGILADLSVVTDKDIRAVNSTGGYLKFLNNVSYVPWVTVQSIDKRSWKFIVDTELRDICNRRTPRPELNSESLDAFYLRLREEITKRRKEAEYKRAKAHKQWCPENVITNRLCKLIDWIEDELDKLKPITTGMSTNAQETAATSLNMRARQEATNGKEDQLKTNSTHKGVSSEVHQHDAGSRGA